MVEEVLSWVEPVSREKKPSLSRGKYRITRRKSKSQMRSKNFASVDYMTFGPRAGFLELPKPVQIPALRTVVVKAQCLYVFWELFSQSRSSLVGVDT